MGFVQFLPSTWRTEAAAAPGSPRDPYHPLDAMTVARSYLHRIEVGAVGGGQHDLRGALPRYGGSTAYADQVLALAAPAITTSSLPVVLPIPAPGWVKRIPTPNWPADLAAHMSPSGVTNQCVAGPSRPGPSCTLAIRAGTTRRRSSGTRSTCTASPWLRALRSPRQPAPGEMVVYGSSYGLFGHIATVVAVEPGRYEVIEQDFLDFSPNLEPHWKTFDVRSVAWPDPAVVGFVLGPPGG